MRKNIVLTFIFSVCIASGAYARPVSYPAGWTLMQRNDGDKSLVHVHYSPTKDYSIGYQAAYWRKAGGYQTHSVQLNNLIKRWNKTDSQANFYLKSGAGVAYDSSNDLSSDVEPHAFTGIALDWEDRRYFIQYANEYHYAGDINEEYSQFLHFGVAPYIGEYGDLHTWLMLKVEHQPEEKDNFTVTPHVRFFKDVYLVEIGVSENEDILFNFIIRY